MNLDLVTVAKTTLENSYDVQILKYDILIAKTKDMNARSLFDTILSGKIKYNNDETQPSSSLFGSKSLLHNYELDLSKKTSSGTTFGANLNHSRTWSNAQTAPTNPYYESSLGVTIKQELGKNLFGIQDRGGLVLTALDIENAGHTSWENIESFIAKAQNAYWDLVLAHEQVKIALDFVDQAKYFFDLNQDKLKDGLSELPEVIAAEANYRTRQKELTLAQNVLQAQENQLRLFLNLSKDVCFTFSEGLFIDFDIDGDDDILAKAFLNRQDYKRVLNFMKASNIELILANNNLWPEINLEGSLAKNGVDDSIYRSAQSITAEDHTEYSIGLLVSMPLENRKAKAAHESAELDKTRTLLLFKSLERTIIIEVLNQARDARIYKEVASSSTNVAKLQAEKLKEEEKRFNSGRSNTDTIIRYQEDLLLARLQEISDKARYLKAIVDLQVKSGVLLKQYLSDQ